MPDIKLPNLSGLSSALGDLSSDTGFTNTFSARLGKLDGTTVTDPDRPFTGANQYVWYTASGKEHLALIGSMAGVPYSNTLWGLPVMIGNPPKNLGFGPTEQVVIGLSGTEGRYGAGGNNVYDTYITNVSYVDLNHIRVLRVEPSSGMTVNVMGDWAYPDLTTLALKIFTTTSFSASAGTTGLAANQHRLGLVYINPTTGAVGMLSGTLRASPSGSVPYRADFTAADLTGFNVSAVIPCGVVYFYFGQTTIAEADCLRNLEVRSIFYPPYLLGGAGTTGTVVHGRTTNYTALATDIWIGCNTTGGSINITLPAATAAMKGHVITVADEQQVANVFPIYVQPGGTDLLDNVYSFGAGRAIQIIRGKVTVMCIDPGYWVTIGSDRTDWTFAYTADGDMGNHNLVNVNDPILAKDAANKQYVDASSGGGAGGKLYTYFNLG